MVKDSSSWEWETYIKEKRKKAKKMFPLWKKKGYRYAIFRETTYAGYKYFLYNDKKTLKYFSKKHDLNFDLRTGKQMILSKKRVK